MRVDLFHASDRIIWRGTRRRRGVRGVLANLDKVGIERIRRDSKVIVALVLVDLVRATVFQLQESIRGHTFLVDRPKT